MLSQTVTDISIYPYYPGIATEVAPVMFLSEGQFYCGQILGQQAFELKIEKGEVSGEVQVGAAYSWRGRDQSGEDISSHWLYCTDLGSAPTFGAICDWSRGGATSPLLPQTGGTLLKLEELSDIAAILSSPANTYGQAQAQLGKRGWLVMTTTTAPAYVGILIESPTLPMTFAEGTRDVSISAISVRTMQTVNLSRLYCAQLGETALFLNLSDP